MTPTRFSFLSPDLKTYRMDLRLSGPRSSKSPGTPKPTKDFDKTLVCQGVTDGKTQVVQTYMNDPPTDDELPGLVATDGVRFVASLWRNDQSIYENGQDLYWGELPTV